MAKLLFTPETKRPKKAWNAWPAGKVIEELAYFYMGPVRSLEELITTFKTSLHNSWAGYSSRRRVKAKDMRIAEKDQVDITPKNPFNLATGQKWFSTKPKLQPLKVFAYAPVKVSRR